MFALVIKNQVIDEQKNILLLYREIPGPVRHNVASVGASMARVRLRIW